jgi:hypothetical protein
MDRSVEECLIACGSPSARGPRPAALAGALRWTFDQLRDLSHRGVAKVLNERGIKTTEGSAWSAVQVMRVRRRLGL